MSEHPITTMVTQYYDDLHKNTKDKNLYYSRINHEDLPSRVVDLFNQLSPETILRYYGAGFFVPENIRGCRILDIGCGSGSFVFILSKMVGPDGFVVGIDISSGLIDSCNKVIDYHTKAWGYDKPNVEFHVANAERLLELGFKDFDVIVSNGCWCVFPDHQKAFNNVWHLLKTGGKFYLNDVYTRYKLSDEIKNDKELQSFGLPCAMTWEEMVAMTDREGFTTPYLTQFYSIGKKDENMWKKLKDAQFCIASSRMFKLPSGAKRGAATVVYKGNIEDYPDCFPWDKDLTFKKGERVNVDSELATILVNTDFKENFVFGEFTGSVSINKNQNPFQRLDKLREEGNYPDPIYDL